MSTPPDGVSGRQAGVDGHLLVVLADMHVWTYDLDTDKWTQLPDPPRPMRGDDFLAVGGGTLYLTSSGRPYRVPRYERLDLSTGIWTWLPPSKNLPLLHLRRLFVTPDGIVVIGATGDVNGVHTHGQAEFFEHGQWTRLPDPHVLSYGMDWHWTGERLVAPLLEDEDHGASLNVSSRQWGTLPGQPDILRRGLVTELGDG